MPPPARVSTPMFNYRRGDYQAMNDYFSGINWAQILNHNNIEANWNLFCVMLLTNLFQLQLLSSMVDQRCV